MGCWNETCGLSRLPIFVGNEIVCIITASRKPHYASRSYYYDDTAFMFSLPFRGKYNDYGGVEDIECEDFIKDFLMQKEYFIGNRRDDELNAFIPESFEDLIENISDGDGVYVNLDVLDFDAVLDGKNQHIGKKKELIYLTLWMCHAELYDSFVDTVKKEELYGDYYTTKLRNDITGCIENIKELNKFRSSNLFTMEMHQSSFRGTCLCGREFDMIGYTAQQIISDEENADNYIAKLEESARFAVAMDISRNAFFGQSGYGSQSDDMELQKITAEFICKFVKERTDENNE